MERWVLEGDTYSFLRSTPHTFNLQTREGPNRVEIFDITSIPSHHNAISETTCLCDIFGDDGEPPSLSSSPASATLIRREVDQSFQGDDANDSLGSYHTANGSDLSENAEVAYNTPSPENTPDFSTSGTRESHSPPAKSSISSDSKNGLNQLDCMPPASKGNSNYLSHTDNWEESQASVITAPVNEMGIKNASEPQYVNSTPATTLIIPEKEPSNPTSCSSEEKEPAIFEQEGIITTPREISTSPFLDKQIYESDCESLAVSSFKQNDVMSPESTIDCSPREHSVLFAQGTMNSGSASELSNTSPTDCIFMQEMSTSLSNRDINFLPIPSLMSEPRLTCSSPVSRETTSTPASTGRSSLELLTPDMEDTYGATLSVSTLHNSENVEIDSLSVSDISTETRGLVYSSINGRERLESPEINETCSSTDHLALAHSQEPVLIYSPVGYTISPSLTYEKIFSSVEPQDHPSSPVSPEINETCHSLDHSTPAQSQEQVMIHSPEGYTIGPSPTIERIVSSTEPEDSPPFPVSPEINETCASPHHSASACSPEQVMIHSPVGYTISPSFTSERIVSSTEPEDSPPFPVSPEINETCASPHHSASACSPEQVMIYSPVGYTISPSFTIERIVSSTEPEDSPSSPVSPEINETCHSLDHSTPAQSQEQVMIHSPEGYTIGPSPTIERIVSSTEPEDSPPFPVSPEINETCASPHHSASACSPEQVMIHSPVGYTISPSFTSERIVSSTEPEDSPPFPVSPEINETCASPHHSASACSPEQVMIYSPVGYTISPSFTSERIVSSTEPEDSPSSPVSPEINETCTSLHHSASACSPEQVMIHSPVGYTISPSPTNEKRVYSTDPVDSPSFPLVTRIEYTDICSSPDHSEPLIIHPSPCYNISPSSTNEREVYSTEPDDSASCGHSDMHSSSDHSISAHSPEPEIIHSPIGYTISPSPTNKIMFLLGEANDLSSSSAITGTDYTATPTCSRDSTPALRSITSTPNSRENYLTPETNSPAPTLELRAVTCSPEIKTISYSVLPQNTKSPGIKYNVTPTEDLTQSPADETNVCDNYSETSSYLSENDTSVLPSSRIFLPTPESRSKPSSPASDHTKHTALYSDLQPEPSITLEKGLSINCEGVNHPITNPIDNFDCFNDNAVTKTLKSPAFVSDECNGSAPPVQTLQDSTSKTSDSGLPTIKIEKSQEIVIDNTTELTFSGTQTSLHPWDASLPKPVASLEKKHCHVEVFDRNNETEIVKNDFPSSDKRLSHGSVALRESPGVISRDSGGEFDRQQCREREKSGKKEGEGEETMGETRYRGEQVELSFSARNRKGPAGHSPALSSRDPKSGIPACCYFESHPTTLQQQSQLRAQGSQQENKVGARRLQSAAQGKYSSAGFLPPKCTGETSGMGSEFDEADNEVKWFTDLAFRSLSSPQVDYLDVYNSSHRSSTNVSQPSTIDSPGAVAWMTYADLRGSTLHENDGSSFLPCDGLDPNKRLELGSFECVDVALESKEQSSRGKRTVPKRQIQLLRRNTDELKNKGNNENILNSPFTYRRSKDSLVRQHSTPAFVQEDVSKEVPDSPQNDRKKTLQKSLSLDDGSPRTQMASCIIKSVLSKKMQDVQKETEKCTEPIPSRDKSKHPDASPSSLDSVPSTMEKHSHSSSQHSECTLSSESFAVEEERISHHQPKKFAPKVPPKPFLRPAFFNSGEARLAGNIAREETKPIVAPPQADDKIQSDKSDRKERGGSNLKEKHNSDSANASISNTSPVVATPAVSMQNKMTTRDIKKRQMTPENQEQLAGKSVFMSKTPEITLKPSSIKGKKTSSLKVSLSPDLEQSREISESHTQEKVAEDISTKSTKVTETENDDDSNKKSVIHRVRDVRKLVKNTYNLSFKASNLTSTAEETMIQGKTEKPPQTPPALHIECKAISWKDKQTSGSKAIHCQDEKQPVDISKISQPWVCTETKRDTDITEIPSKGSSPKAESKQKAPYSHSTATDGLPESESINKRANIHCDQSSKMPPRPPSKERDVSALVVLPDCTSKTKTVSPTTLDSSQMEAASNSHSVSMLLKEKGMQADIGVCDVLTDGASATAKHVNRLEVPVQSCLSESILCEAQVKADNASLPCNPTAVNDSSRTSQTSESSKETLTEEPLTKEHEKKKTAIITTTQITPYLATSGKSEVKSFSSSTKNNATPVNASKEIELPIQVRSISTDRLKPFVPPKPSYKQSFAEIKSVSSDQSKADTQGSSVIKQQTMSISESKKNETPSTVTHRDQPNETSSRRLAVSAVSSCKPPSIPVTTTPSVMQKSAKKTLSSLDQPSAFLQTTSTGQQQTPSFSQNQSVLDSSFASSSAGPQALNHTPSLTRASSNNRFHTDDYLFYASDDPPSYDERESFSPLRLSDLPPHRSCRYHPTTKQSSCSCTSSSHSHQGHPNNSPQERVPAASRSPGEVLTCPGAPPQAQVRPHQCRPDGLPASNTTIPHASAMIQPLHNPRACHVSNSQSYGDDHPPASGLMNADRRPANHPSPQATGPASYHEYSHSANMSTLDHRPQLFNPQDLPPSFGHDFANEGPGGAGVLYPENAGGLSCGQGPRRVLLDPETGKYFYIEVPMQPLRKMLFDPELGQYVEVLIPQQAMSHSALYPSAAPPYSSLHSPGLYAPQYLPYAVPSYPAISGGAPQVRHPEPPPVPTTLHQTSLRYGNPASQMPKNEPKGHSSLDQSYLESMYYIPTGMNASPNATPSDCYHKPSSMPPSGGRRA